jgi:hypothetical protein
MVGTALAIALRRGEDAVCGVGRVSRLGTVARVVEGLALVAGVAGHEVRLGTYYVSMPRLQVVGEL